MEHVIYAGNASGAGVVYTPGNGATGSTTAPAIHGSAPGDGGPATAATVAFAAPTGLAADSVGNLYITDTSGWVRKVDTSGTITTFAGGIAVAKTPATTTCPGGTTLIGDGCPANEAYFNSPRAIAIDPATGDIYIAENTGNRIRKVSHSTYLVTTVVGLNSVSASTSGTATTSSGDLTNCATTPGATCSGTIGLLKGLRGIAVDRHGNLYIADNGINQIGLANFTTGQLSVVGNLTGTKGSGTTTCLTISGGTLGAATLGAVTDVAFDPSGNMYIADSTCAMVFKVAENPTTQMVDSNSIVTLIMGVGTGSTSTFANQPAISVAFTPAVVRSDLAGNLYITESTGTHVWFYDAATKQAHTIFGGGSGAQGDCYNVPASGTLPYVGCDGFHSVPATNGGSAGLAFDAWGNLYISDAKSFYIHKLLLGTSGPFVPTTPAGNANGLLHFGAGDSLASLSTTAAPDFTVTPGTCTTNNAAGQDNTQDCPITVVNSNGSANPQYEQFSVVSTLGSTVSFPLTNQAFPVCQPNTAISKSVAVSGPTAVTLGFTPGAACTGIEKLVAAPHKYTYTLTSQPTHGVLTGTPPAVTYTPSAGYNGPDSFQYTVTDNSAFAPATVTYDGGLSTIVLETPSTLTGSTGTISLKGNSAPVATPQSVTVSFNTAKAVTLAATDADNDPLTYAVVTSPTHGTLSGTAPNLTYTPTAGYNGADSFTFKANDGKLDSNIATVSITVNPAAPTPTPQSVTVAFQTATPITLAATGVAPITYAVATSPTHGTLSGTAPNLTYTPTGTYSGPDSFTFTATNTGGSSVGTISITVEPGSGDSGRTEPEPQHTERHADGHYAASRWWQRQSTDVQHRYAAGTRHAGRGERSERYVHGHGWLRGCGQLYIQSV